MALEDTVASYTINVVQTGSAAPTVQELKNVETAAVAGSASLRGIAADAKTTSSSFADLGGKVYFVRSGIDAVRFAAAGGGTRAAFYALDEGVRAFLQSGLKISSIVPVLTSVGIPLIALGEVLLPTIIAGWEAYKAKEEEAASAVALHNTLLREQATDLKLVNAAQKEGLLTNDQVDQLKNVKLNPQSAGYNPTGASRELNQLNLSKPGIEAAVQLKQLSQEINDAALSGFDLQQQKAKETYDKQMQELKNIAVEQHKTFLTQAEMETAHDTFGYNMSDLRSKNDPGLQKLADQAAQNEGNKNANYLSNQDSEIDEAGRQQELEDDQKLDAQWKQMVVDAKQLAAVKLSALNEVVSKEKELQQLENRVDLDNATGEQKKQLAIKQTTAALQQQFDELAKELGLSPQQIAAENLKIAAAAKNEAGQVDASRKSLQDINQEADQAANSFANGFSNAFVAFVDGTKTAKQAFTEFAASFLEQMAQMIIKQELLSMLGKAGTSGTSGSGSGILGAIFGTLGTGGVRFAASGMAGVGDVSSPTYFPRFNVLAGEAGREMLTVLARPTFRSIGGMDAVVGNAGPNRLAITNADDLARRGGGAGVSGHIHIQIEHTPETQARIVSQAINGAEVRVTKNMNRNTKLRQAVRQGTTT